MTQSDISSTFDPTENNPLKQTLKGTYPRKEDRLKLTVNRKVRELSKYIKFSDLFTCILSLVGCIFAQLEQDEYYNHNSDIRIAAMKVYNDLKYNSGSNISSFEIPIQILETINYSVSASPEDIHIPLKISNSSFIYRIIILISTIFSVIFLFSSCYYRYEQQHKLHSRDETHFIRTSPFRQFLLQSVILLIFPYPGLNSYYLQEEMKFTMCMPLVSLTTAFSLLRIVFLIKTIKHFTVFYSPAAEEICERNYFKPDSAFVFKALQKEKPFSFLLFLVVLTCFCLGQALRTFELQFWEARDPITQDWSYFSNALWCIFVSMTTVGYGDFYPRTHVGRLIALVSCVIGLYFVTQLMVFLSVKSSLSETEMDVLL